MTFNSLLKQKGWISINFQTITCKEHAIIQFWVIFHLRRYLRELGAFDLDKEQPTPKRVLESIRDLSQRVYPSLPTTVADLLRPPLNLTVTSCLTPAAVAAVRLPSVHLEAAQLHPV